MLEIIATRYHVVVATYVTCCIR